MRRREFLTTAAGTLAGAAALPCSEPARDRPAPKPVVVVIRHDDLTANPARIPPQRLRDLLDEGACVLAGTGEPADAWAGWFRPRDRVGIKVNCLGLSTNPLLAESIADAILSAELAPERVIIWDRFDRELRSTGYQLSKSGRGRRCYGTDSLSSRGTGGYDPHISSSGEIGSLYSRIVTEEVDALVSAAVLKDHNLAGLSGTMKNFYGAIHNPNKYHDNGCDPFVADVCAHNHIRGRLRLAVCDATRPQYQGGPPVREAWRWPYGGILMSNDPVALDRVALEILERKRAAAGMKSLAEENRPARYIASAGERGLGTGDLSRIEVISIGKTWTDTG